MRVHRSILTLSGAHFLVDCYSSMLGAFLPFLYAKLGLSLAQAGLLSGALVFSSSLMQPVYGYLADRLRHKAFASLAPAVAGVFICSLGLAPNFATLVLLLVLGGVGIASFHPQGAAITSHLSGGRPGYAMSVFITGGLIGYSLGPVYITGVITSLGLERSIWAAVPGVVVSAYLLLKGPSPDRTRRPTHFLRFAYQLRNRWRPILLLYLIVVIRSVLQLTFVAFLPLYLTTRGFGEMRASQYLTLFLMAGGIATLLGGILADRFGGKRLILTSSLLCGPSLLIFLWGQSPWNAIFLAAGGAFLLCTSAVHVVMGQRLVPEAASTVASLLMGFAWGVGGMLIPVIGAMGDQWSLHSALVTVAAASLVSALLAWGLPSDRPGRDPAEEVSEYQEQEPRVELAAGPGALRR